MGLAVNQAYHIGNMENEQSLGLTGQLDYIVIEIQAQ